MLTNGPSSASRKTFLQILPPEIRDQIFRYVLVSPTGAITLTRASYRQLPLRYKIFAADSDNPELLTLSLLRTCKQIYVESKHTFWRWNTLDIEELKHQHSREGNSIRGLPVLLTSQVQNIRMDADFICRREAQPNQELHAGLEVTRNLRELSKWRSLKELTVVLRDKFDVQDPVNFSHEKLKRLMDMRQQGEKLGVDPLTEATEFQLLYKLCLLSFVRAFRSPSENRVPSQSLAHVKRNLVINTGLSTWRKGMPTRSMNPEKGDPNEMLQELHAAFGGSLWFDGRLIFERGFKMPIDKPRDAFTLMPHPREFIANPESDYWDQTLWFHTKDLEQIGKWKGLVPDSPGEDAAEDSDDTITTIEV